MNAPSTGLNRDTLARRFASFWLCENETALMSVTCIRDGCHFIQKEPADTSQQTLYRWYMDAEEVYKRNITRIENTFFGGDAFPVITPHFGTAGHAKYFRGCQYQFANETVWYFPSLEDGTLPEYQSENSILSLELSCLRQLCEHGTGNYLVAQPDNCGTIDALAHLRGSDRLLVDMLENPAWVQSCTRKIMEGYFDSSRKFYEASQENNFGGCSHGWMQLWADGTVQQLQGDLSVMISPAMFETFVLPELEEACNWLDYSIYHFDGQEQIRHLNMLLSIRNLNAIQWTHVAGQPETTEFIPVFRRIQSAGKGLVLFPESTQQAKALLENLNPQGLYLITQADNEAEAKIYLELKDCYHV